jgi:arylsulfatase A-like enzyme
MLDDESPDTTPFYMPRTYEKFAGPHWYNFTQAVTPTPLCGPARATFLTGQTVDHHGMNCNTTGKIVCDPWKLKRDKLVPKALADVGVWVGWYGKRTNWDHECGKVDGPTNGWPNLPGVVDDHVHYKDTDEMFDKYQLVENGVPNSYNVATQGPSAYGTYKTADLTLAGIESCASPCTLYWMPMAPHAPGTPPPDYDPSKVVPGAVPYQPAYNEGCPGAVDPSIADKPYALQTYTPCIGASSQAWKRTKTAATLQGVDNRLPELIDAFLAKNPENPKRIIFTSDHGRQLGNHRHVAKEDPYEMSVRIPLWIYDSDAPGGTVDTLVSLRDLPATMLDWQSATPLLPIDGRSLVPLYTGTATDWYTDTYISHLNTANSLDGLRPWRAVRQDCTMAAAENRHCLKVVRYPPAVMAISGIGDVSFPEEWEVYVLDEDPWELTNVHANAFTGYAGVPGWDDTNPELAAAKASLAAHVAAGR